MIRRASRLALLIAVVAGLVLGAGSAGAKRFRYAAGPRVPEDTVLSVAQVELEPIVRKRGPRVPATNLQLTSLVANTAFERALANAPLPSGTQVTLAPSASHPLNFVVEHAILRHLSTRGVTVHLHHEPATDDSAMLARAGDDDPVLEYQVSSARIAYLRLVGWLPGRVRIERQSMVEGSVTLRDARTSRVLWTGDASYNLLDSFPRGSLALVEDARFPDLHAPAPGRNIDKLAEPVIVVGIVSGLIALFFQNRP